MVVSRVLVGWLALGLAACTSMGPSGLSITPAQAMLAVGEVLQLQASASGNLEWSSSHPAVLSIDSQGRATAISKGSALIQAKLGSVTANAQIEVLALPQITAFSASANQVPAGGGEVTLSWQTQEATRLWLNPGQQDVSGLSQVTVKVKQDTVFTLQAENPVGQSSQSLEVKLLVASFALQIEPAVYNAYQGGSVEVAVKVLRQPGFVTPVQLSLKPHAIVKGVAANNLPVIENGAIKFLVADIAALGEYTLEVQGSADGQSVSQSFKLYVLPALSPQDPGVWVSPLLGSDANPGTQAKPFKTLKKAVSVVSPQHTVFMMPGEYTKAGGEDWPLTLPAGLTLEATDTGVTLLGGGGLSSGLVLKGNTLKGLQIKHFLLALQAQGGQNTLNEVGMEWVGVGLSVGAATSVNVINSSFSTAGLAINSSGNLSLSGAVFNQVRIGLSLEGNSSTVVMSSLFQNAIGGDCSDPAYAVIMENKATLNATNLNVSNFLGTALWMQNQSQATLSNSLMDKVGDGCNKVMLGLKDSAHLNLNGGSFNNLDALAASVFYAVGNATANITGSHFSRNPGGGSAIGYAASGKLLVKQVHISGFYGAVVAYGNVEVDQATITGASGYGLIAMSGSQLKLRRSTLSQNGVGVMLLMPANLGTAADPGQNSFAGNVTAGIKTSNNMVGTIQAVGNTWNPNLQGANAQGKYAAALINGPKNGLNYVLEVNAKLQF